ncbi:hypothetical protein [Streptomyces sp. DG1A-41]|uniref:hypothetical protein n=1 Tax=Streptomyces sp. DG1A-41 TaxID=3125779 RepID=UPI0030D1004E
MTWSAVLLSAAVRMLRTAAGRRALQVALLVGGVLVIGLLCGERAYAADGADGRVDSPGPRPVSGVGSARIAGVSEAVGAVGERGVRVAGHTGEAVSKGLGAARAKEPSSSASTPTTLSKLPVLSAPPSASKSPVLPDLPVLSAPPMAPKPPTLPDLPALPKPPVLPDLPDLPDFPDLPDLPGLPAPSGPSNLLPAPAAGAVTLPGGPGLPAVPGGPSYPELLSHPRPAPVTAGSQPGRAAPSPAGVPASVVGRTGAAEFVAAGADTVVCGAEYRAVGRAEHAGHTGLADHAGPSAHVGRAPGGHGPADRPDGRLGNRSTADNSTSRHGDPHAVTLSLRAPLRLLPGVAARSCAAGSRDSHRDIPVFPG